MILAFVAAIMRVMFTKLENFRGTVSIFIGSILFGMIVGYILNDVAVLRPYLKGIIVVFSLFGKELYVWCERFFKNPKDNIGLILTVVNMIRSIQIGIVPIKKEDNKNDVN